MHPFPCLLTKELLFSLHLQRMLNRKQFGNPYGCLLHNFALLLLAVSSLTGSSQPLFPWWLRPSPQTVIRPNPTHLILSPWFKHEHVIQIWLIKSERKSFEEFSRRISLKLKKKKTKTITFLFLCLGFSVWAGNCCHISGSQREPTSEAKLNCPGSLRRKRETARILEGSKSLILPAQELSCLWNSLLGHYRSPYFKSQL